MKTIKFLAISFLLILATVSEAQNLLTCELPRNFKKKSVFELKDNESKIIANYSIKPAKSGWKIKEGEDLEMKVKYLRSRKVYVIEILTPVYEENILNLLACYYAVRKCKEIIKSKRNYNHFVFFAGTGII